MMMKSALY